jgi:mitogen-activated protein kinase kinase kinase 13
VSATQGSKNGKGKQVDFGQVDVVDITGAEESDLTDLAELDDQSSELLSPRRLRSKGDKTQRKSGVDSGRKTAFTQKAKRRAAELPPQVEDEGLPDVSDEDEDENEEQPVYTPSKAGPSRNTGRGRRTPVKSRLRPRPAQTHTPPSDGDDEEEEEEETIEEDAEEGDAEEDRADLSDEDTEAPSTKPRILRSGKVVSAGEAPVEMEEVEDEEISVDGDETINDETASVQSESTSDIEGEEEDSDMEGDVGEESIDECERRFFAPRGRAQTDLDRHWS